MTHAWRLLIVLCCLVAIWLHGYERGKSQIKIQTLIQEKEKIVYVTKESLAIDQKPLKSKDQLLALMEEGKL